MSSNKAVDLGKLQTEHEQAQRLLRNSEAALKRAQDLRDKARHSAGAAAQALADGFRTVQG